jgi:alkaline phosphatase D
MAAEDLDFVVHLGDYQYEYDVGENAGVRNMQLDPSFRRETVTLPEYRNRYALTKLDPDLQAAHAAFSWIQTWDDHELENNWAGELAEPDHDGLPDGDPASFQVRKAAAFQAHYEHMPLRLPQRPSGASAALYRRLGFGGLLDMHVLDTRSFRSDQVPGARTAMRHDPSRTLLGDAQERWLLDGWTASRARWNVLAQQNALAQLDVKDGPEILVPMDTWDGYAASRDRVLGGAYRRKVRNLVSIGGDLHRSVASDLKLDFADPDSPTVGSEFVGTSITSGLDGMDNDAGGLTLLRENPHIKYGNFQRGYVSCTITPRQWISDFRVVDRVTVPNGTVSTRAKLLVEDGRPGIQTL